MAKQKQASLPKQGTQSILLSKNMPFFLGNWNLEHFARQKQTILFSHLGLTNWDFIQGDFGASLNWMPGDGPEHN